MKSKFVPKYGEVNIWKVSHTGELTKKGIDLSDNVDYSENVFENTNKESKENKVNKLSCLVTNHQKKTA